MNRSNDYWAAHTHATTMAQHARQQLAALDSVDSSGGLQGGTAEPTTVSILEQIRDQAQAALREADALVASLRVRALATARYEQAMANFKQSEAEWKLAQASWKDSPTTQPDPGRAPQPPTPPGRWAV